MRFIYRDDPEFWRFRIIELIQIRECQLRGEEHDRSWWDLLDGLDEMWKVEIE